MDMDYDEVGHSVLDSSGTWGLLSLQLTSQSGKLPIFTASLAVTFNMDECLSE